MNDELMERLARALANSQARDDEGEYERLADMIGFSGENKLWTVLRAAVQAILSELSAAGVLNEWKPIESAPCDGTQFIAWGRFDCGTLWLNTDVYRWRDNWISVGDGIVCPQEWCSLPEAIKGHW